MPTTARGLRYPTADMADDVPLYLEQLAEDVDRLFDKSSGYDLFMSDFDTDPLALDHTAAFIAALDAAHNEVLAGFARIRIILDSRPIYTIGGPLLVGAHGEHAQVPLPYSDTVAGTIELKGAPGGGVLYTGLGQSGTVIRSTLTAADVPAFTYAGSGAGVGLASIFGGPSSYVHPFREFHHDNYLQYSFEDVAIRSPAPVICGIDAGYLNGFFFNNLVFDTDEMASMPGGSAFTTTDLTVCTAMQAIPIVFPLYQSYYGAKGGSLAVAGWATGPVVGELLNAEEILVFFVPGAAINVDVAAHSSRIGMLKDWNNAYGIAAYYPQAGYGTVPPDVRGAASQQTFPGALASALLIDAWDAQMDNGGSNVALTRVYDLLDTNNVTPVEAVIGKSNFAGGDPLIPADLLILEGQLSRIKDKIARPGPQVAPAMPPTTTWIRNPYGRDALVTFGGAAVDNIWVQSRPTGKTTGPVLVGASGVVGWVGAGPAPTWDWICL